MKAYKLTQQDKRMLRTFKIAVEDESASPDRIDYARRYFAEQEAHALTRHERDRLAEGLRREQSDAAGLRMNCLVLYLVSGALFAGLLILGGRTIQ